MLPQLIRCDECQVAFESEGAKLILAVAAEAEGVPFGMPCFCPAVLHQEAEVLCGLCALVFEVSLVMALASHKPLCHLLGHSRVEGISRLGHWEPLCAVQVPNGLLILGRSKSPVDKLLRVLSL